MEMSKNSVFDQDPDYVIPFDSVSCLQNIFEIEARAKSANKISKIIDAEFLNEISRKKSEIYSIYRNLNKACKMLHYLRFAIITDFYNQENNCDNEVNTLKQFRLHPTVNSLSTKRSADVNRENNCFKKFVEEKWLKRKTNQEFSEAKKICSQNIHFKNKVDSLLKHGVKCKTKRRIIVGNLSKWIPPEFRSDNASHKWTVYLRDSEKYDVSKFVSKVRFFLHPSYKPNDVIELSSPPFHLSRHGWGEFPIRVQLHFVNNFDKPIDVIHNLKLDRTFTGLQTIGSETVVDIWISSKYIKESSPILSVQTVRAEETEDVKKCENVYKPLLESKLPLELDHDYTCFININSYEKKKKHVEIKKCVSNNDYCGTNVNIDNSLKIVHKNHILQKNYVSILIPKNSKDLKKYNFPRNPINETLKTKHKVENYDNIYYTTNYLEIGNNSLRNTLTHLMQWVTPKSVFSTLKFITHRMPLITEESVDSNYKLLHPFATESFQIFSKFSKGKQESLERCRAVTALNTLKSITNFTDICNTKEFIIWSRRYCYSPLLFNIKDVYSNLYILDDFQDNKKYKLSSTISDKVNKWFLHCHKIDPNVFSFKNETQEIIDILNVSKCTTDSLSSNNLKKKENKVILMEYPNFQTSLSAFVSKSVQKIGIKLQNEEIISGVSHNTANTLMTKALLCLVDEIVRLAFSCALDRCKDQTDSMTISTEDIRMALLKREEFEIFTNAGLGSEG